MTCGSSSSSPTVTERLLTGEQGTSTTRDIGSHPLLLTFYGGKTKRRGSRGTRSCPGPNSCMVLFVALSLGMIAAAPNRRPASTRTTRKPSLRPSSRTLRSSKRMRGQLTSCWRRSSDRTKPARKNRYLSPRKGSLGLSTNTVPWAKLTNLYPHSGRRRAGRERGRRATRR